MSAAGVYFWDASGVQTNFSMLHQWLMEVTVENHEYEYTTKLNIPSSHITKLSDFSIHFPLSLHYILK